MTQKEMATHLIRLTLYKNQGWLWEGKLQPGASTITRAKTTVDDCLVTLDYNTSTIAVEGKQLRVSKELKTDLLTIVRLKIAKMVKNAKLN